MGKKNSSADDFAKVVGSKMKLRRVELNLTQKQLSEMTGIRQATISLMEMGEIDVRTSTLFSLCEALKIDIVFKPKK